MTTPIELDEEEEETTMDARCERVRQEIMYDMIEKASDHEEWIGSNMNSKSKQTGLRIATLNFQRKLYGSKENMIETIMQMQRFKIDIMVATEPGQGSKVNTVTLKNTMREHGYAVATLNRDDKTIGGGIVMILGPQWAKLPTKQRAYKPDKKELKGRILEVIISNKTEGAHNKIQIIGFHALNSAEKEEADTIKLLQWIQDAKSKFAKSDPLATTIVIGDLNAAVRTALDTDRGEKENRLVDSEEEETDAFVIKALTDMHLVDTFRGRYPTTRATTRVSKDTTQTNRLLDRILMTAEAASHPATEIAIMRHQFINAGSDHRLVAADLPIDTAGIAVNRVDLWKKTVITKWIRDTDELGKTDPKKCEEFNERLTTTERPQGFQQYSEWIMQAAQGTILKQTTRTYPKRASLKELYTKEDHKSRANLQTLRHIQGRNQEGRDQMKSAMLMRRKLNPVKDTVITTEFITKTTNECKKGRARWSIEEAIENLETHLNKKNRESRATQIRENIKRRDRRFKDKSKKMLKMVINSLMRRYRDNEEIVAVDKGEERAYNEEEVKVVVKKFYQDWMASRVNVEERYKSWEDMIEFKLDNLQNQEHRHMIQTAYIESRNKNKRLQEQIGIWDLIRARVTAQDIKRVIKTMKKGTAPGPSGMTYDMLDMLQEELLEPIAEIVNQSLEGKEIDPEMNKTLLRPLAKTDQGLADLGKMRPIALMEAIMKILERVIFTRIMTVIKEHDMLRAEQHGSLAGKSVQSPIRALTELIEDAITSGKELHIWSADISKAFDSLEYWSQAMGWSALGMPADLIEILVRMDSEGQTAVILGQGRMTDWYKNGRGVRQGSIGGPIKWVIFINFWLEYAYKNAENKGYRMSEAEETDSEALGQVFVDDSNWFANETEGMNLIIKLGEQFMGFHGLNFNKDKCEYMVLNQRANNEGEYPNPVWSGGQSLTPKMREGKDMRHAKDIDKGIAELRENVLRGENKRIRQQPSVNDYCKIDTEVEEWEEMIKNKEINKAIKKKERVVDIIESIKNNIYAVTDPEDHMQETQEWANAIEKLMIKSTEVDSGRGSATRYLGVMFEMNTKWKVQREVLKKKFKDLNERINTSKPNREQATYCVNAVINAAMRFPLQVAHMPGSVLRAWDAANRKTIRNAGKLPTRMGELLHEPKAMGGIGLISIEEAVMKARAEDQIKWLNSESVTGQIVRAAYKRWLKKGNENGTIQQHTMQAIDKIGIKIIEETEVIKDPWQRRIVTRNFKGIEAQTEQDIYEAGNIPRTRVETHAFGDGATWESENRSGWGVEIRQGKSRRTMYGRNAGRQTNDAAEAMAILQALTHTNPMDNLTIYSDNQGCVDIWARECVDNEDTVNSDPGMNNRAIWNRIVGMTKYRDQNQTKTTLLWVHSHVDDENRRKNTSKAKYQCACGGINECTRPGEEGHWIHEGNEQADELAKLGAYCQKPGAEQVRSGESRFIISSKEDNTDIAQGAYKEWIQNKASENRQHGDKTARHVMKQIRSISHQKVFGSMMKWLDQGTISWRFWSRVTLQCLPTHSRMAKFAKGSSTNAYTEVYENLIGEEGKCIRCGHGKETVEHAILECPKAENRWGRAQHIIEQMWEKEGECWNQADWLNKTHQYDGWCKMNAAMGMAPAQIGEYISMSEISKYKLVTNTTKIILETAKAVWQDRNEETKTWVESDPLLMKRKKHADRTGWAETEKAGEHKLKRKKTPKLLPLLSKRIQRTEAKITQAKGVSETKAETESQRVATKYQGECSKLQVITMHPKAMERERERIKREVMQPFNKWARGIRNKTKLAHGTRDLTQEEMGPRSMQNSQPAVSTLGKNHHWVPRLDTAVEAFWTGEGEETLGNLTGRWWEGKIIAHSWPEDKGIPGVTIKYKGGHQEWHGMESCGITVRPKNKQKAVKGKPYTTMFPEKAIEWLGIGARLRIKWIGGPWEKGIVMGKDRHGVIVRYEDGSTVTHNDLHKRGCQIKEFRRDQDNTEYLKQRPWMDCPYDREEDDCECWPCESRKWPEICAQEKLTGQQEIELMAKPPWERRETIQKWRDRSQNPESGVQEEKSPGHDSYRSAEAFEANGAGTNSRASDRGDAQSGDPHEERTYANTKGPHNEDDPLEQVQGSDRESAGGQDLGMGRGRGGPRQARAQGHKRLGTEMAEGEREGDAHGKRPCSMGAEWRRVAEGKPRGRKTRGGGSDQDLDPRERTAGKRTRSHARAHDAKDARGQRQAGEDPGRETSAVLGPTGPDSTERGRPGRAPKRKAQQRAMDNMDGGLGRVDGDERMGGIGEGGRGNPEEGQTTGRTQEALETCSDGLRRRMGQCGESDKRQVRGNKGVRSGQERPDEHGSKARNDHSSHQPRLHCKRKQRPDERSGKEGGSIDPEMDAGVALAGVLSAVDRQCNQPGIWHSTRPLGELSTEHLESTGGETGAGAGVPERSIPEPRECDREPGGRTAHQVRPGEPSHISPVGPPSAERSPGKKRRDVEADPSGPMRLRQKVTKANVHPDQPELDPEGDHWNGKVRNGQMRRDAQQQEGRQETRGADSRQHPGQEARSREEDRIKEGAYQRSSGQRSGGSAGAGNHVSGDKRKREKVDQDQDRSLGGPLRGPHKKSRHESSQKDTSKPRNRIWNFDNG